MRAPSSCSSTGSANPRRILPGLVACVLAGAVSQAHSSPPGVPGKPDGVVDGDSVALSWAAASDDEGVTGYNVYRDDRYLTTVHDTRYVALLGPGEQTGFYITAFDSPSDGSPRGFSNRSAESIFARGASANPATGDRTDDDRPPAVSDLRSLSASTDAVSLVWNSPAEGIVGYNVYRNGDYLTTVNDESAYIDDRLPTGAESVTYSVVAFDAVPRFSPYSNSLAVALEDMSDDSSQDDGQTPGDDGDNNDDGTDDGGNDSGVPDIEISEYNRTLTEELSVGVNGPGQIDRNRTTAAPSAPTGLVALLIADNWIELDWVPSIDDGEIVAYEIYRDGQLVGTIDEEADPPNTEPRVQELRSLRTTTYIDCNYTKDLNCQRVGQPQPGMSHSWHVVAVDDTGLKSPLSEPLTVTMNTVQGSAAPDPVSEGYTLAFGDDFDGGSLDWQNWLLKMPWGQNVTVNGETQYFVDPSANETTRLPYDPFKMSDDPEAEDGRALKITAIPTPPELLDRVNGKPYLSGVLTTRTKPSGNKRYGYVEIRARVPDQRGLLSTFYLFQPGGNQYEIDILEHVGAVSGGTTQNYHYRDGFRYADTNYKGVPHASPTMKLERDLDPGARYHTYSVLWEPERVIWYVDGIEVRRLSGPRVSDQPMDIVAQLVVGSNWIGAPDDDNFPVSYDIDYIRHWQR